MTLLPIRRIVPLQYFNTLLKVSRIRPHAAVVSPPPARAGDVPDGVAGVALDGRDGVEEGGEQEGKEEGGHLTATHVTDSNK